LIEDFNTGSINIRILFWIQHFNTWIQIKSDVIEALDEALRREGIQNSLPKQDMNIPGSGDELEKKKWS
jgi:small-conductance mechanosensitive channel